MRWANFPFKTDAICTGRTKENQHLLIGITIFKTPCIVNYIEE
jgi:hypothetical protein